MRKKRKQVTSGCGVDNLVNARQGKWVFGTSFVDIGEVDAKSPFPVRLAHDYRIGQPRRMEHSSDEACCFQLLDLFGDELLALHCLFPDSLLDGPRMRTDGNVVLDYFPRNAGDVRRLPRRHIDIRPQESNERAFLFRVESGTDGEGTTSAVLLGGHLLGRWRSCHRLLTLAGGARWCVLDGSAALRRGALAGVGIRALAGLGLLLPPGSFSGKCPAIRCGCRFQVNLVGTDKSILLVARDRDDTYRAWHLQHVIRIVRGRHELGERWTVENPIVRQWKIGNVKSDPLSSEVQLAAKCHRQRDLPLWLAPSRADSLECAGPFELAVRDLEFLEHSGGDQVQVGPAVN